MTWAHAEPAIGMIAANLPALRPLLERALTFLSTLRSRHHSHSSEVQPAPPRPNNYVELGPLRNDVDKDKGNETRIMEGYAGDDARSSTEDGESQADMICPLEGIRVEKTYGVRVRRRES